MSRNLWYVAVLAIVAAGFVLWNYQNPALSDKTNRQVALTCTTAMATQFHIHPHLAIIINGEQQEIPVDIGIAGVCINAIHTHENTGKIHVESPEKRDFTLEDFFFIWGKTFTKDQILDSKADATHRIRETVNGIESQDYEKTVLRDNDQIVISYRSNEQKK